MKEKLNEEEVQARKLTHEVSIPAVYRERGYLLLTLSRREEHVNFYCLREMTYQHLSGGAFLDRFNRTDISPYALALNLLARCAEGFYKVSVRVYRRLVAMATNKEELMKLSERALGREYLRVMALPKPIVKIATDPAVREKYVDEMIEKLREDSVTVEHQVSGEQQPSSEGEEKSDVEQTKSDFGLDAQHQPSEQQQSIPTSEGEDVAAKKKAAAGKKEKKVGAVVKEKRSVSYDPCKVKNPYKEGSKKAKAFDLFKEGGERSAIMKKIEKLGVTEATASTWIYLFKCVATTGRQPDWNKERAKVS